MTPKDHIAPILTAARAIPQALGDQTQHSPEWRMVLQAVRNAAASPAPSVEQLARVYQASLAIFAVSSDEPHAAAKTALRDAIDAMARAMEFHPLVGDEAPYRSGRFYIGGLDPALVPAEGAMVRVTEPPIIDSNDNVVCLGEFELIEAP